jgi:hypothetical protein
VLIPVGLAFFPGVSGVLQGEPHEFGDHVEHADADGGSDPRALAGVERGQDSRQGVEPGPHVGHRRARLGRCFRKAGDRAEATLGLDEEVVGPLLVVGSADAIPRDVDADGPGEARHDVGGGNAQTMGRSGCEILDHDVRLAQQTFKYLPGGLVLDIEGQRLLVPVEPYEVRRHAVDGVVVLAREVAADPVLYLDHPCAEVTEVPAAKRRRDGLLEGDHGQSGQWEGQGTAFRVMANLRRLPTPLLRLVRILY